MKKGVRFIVFFGLMFLFGGTVVGLTDIGRLCIFSAISGVITLDGQPVANAKLIRTGSKERKHTDETTTDEKGYFSFPPMYERSIAKFLPMEFVAEQQIILKYEDVKYELWSGFKRNPEENTEARGEKLIVACKLDSEIKDIWVNGAIFTTMCEWDVEPDAPVDMSNPFEPGT